MVGVSHIDDGARTGVHLTTMCVTDHDGTSQGLCRCQPDLGDTLLLRPGSSSHFTAEEP